LARSILISGLGACGKTLISYGLLVKFRKEGLNVTFFKPVTSAGKRIITEEMNVDVDVLAMKKALMLDEELDTLSPCPIPDRYLELHSKREETIPKILKCFEEVSNGKDLVIIEGRSYPEHMMSIGLSDPEVAQALNSKMILLAKYEGDFVVDQLLLYRDFIRERNVEVIGIIFNSVPIEMLRRLNDTVNPYLERMGMSVIGVIPEEARLISPSVREISEVLRAEVLEGEEYLNGPVEDILCGAMSPEAALKWFRRATNALLVTGGDRTDLILTALETKPSAIVLTGNLFPAVKVLTAAREKRVPILLVPYDTYTTIEMIGEVQSVVTAQSLKRKHQIILDAIEKHVDWRRILNEALK